MTENSSAKEKILFRKTEARRYISFRTIKGKYAHGLCLVMNSESICLFINKNRSTYSMLVYDIGKKVKSLYKYGRKVKI